MVVACVPALLCVAVRSVGCMRFCSLYTRMFVCGYHKMSDKGFAQRALHKTPNELCSSRRAISRTCSWGTQWCWHFHWQQQPRTPGATAARQQWHFFGRIYSWWWGAKQIAIRECFVRFGVRTSALLRRRRCVEFGIICWLSATGTNARARHTCHPPRAS